MISATAYPLAASPDLLDGVRVSMNLDLALLRGTFRMAWVIGCTWLGGGSAHPHALFDAVKAKTLNTDLPNSPSPLRSHAGAAVGSTSPMSSPPYVPAPTLAGWCSYSKTRLYRARLARA